MTLQATELHLYAIAVELGAPVPLSELTADPELVAHADALTEGGMAYARVSDGSVTGLAAAAARAALASGGHPPVGSVVYTTDSLYETTATKDLWRLLTDAGLPRTPGAVVGGSASANLAPALRTAHGLLATEGLETVLLVTADRITDGTRYQPVGVTVLSDGAAACLIGSVPHGPGYRLLASATVVEADAAEVSNSIKAAALVKSGVTRARAELDRRLADPERPFRHLVTGNYSRATRTFLSRLCGTAPADPYTPDVAEVGHSFSADLLRGLADLMEQKLVEPGDRVLVLATSPRSWSMLAVEYVDG
ncbi:hypothetical protein [Streptomyces sp. NPDC093544]|jgi:3-oxoacyl-[acyl-carrier-protein] synthase-3|uniref:hypothetical protein n=1 Tax=Streptomyces sp. NPDC093544 TaxID=3155200 RepID=UPI0034354030